MLPNASAVISWCGQYRYLLRRGPFDKKFMTFIMLNPSTADEKTDDPTLRRCMGFAKREGFESVCIINLYGLRSPRPSDLKHSADPIGPNNDDWVDIVIKWATGPIVAGWGNNADLIRAAQIVAKLDRAGVNVYCLGVNKNGSPKHPLYVRSDAKLTRYVS